MSRYSWIKLYLEILDDSKVAQMPDWMKWRMVQLFLVAREVDQDGLLGPVEELAWRLRVRENALLSTLRQISKIGIVAETPDGWLVVNFKKRQTSESLERVRRFRERQREKEKDKSYRNDECNAAVAAAESSSASASESFSDSPSDSVSEGDRGVGEGGTRSRNQIPAEKCVQPGCQVDKYPAGCGEEC
jgi:hypothetical protein